LYIITFMVLYSIIKPYDSFLVINRHIARKDFILNDLFSGGRNPGKILRFTSQTFFYVRCNDVTQTESGTEVLQTQAEFKYIFVHIELVI
jgi:hypothetical protein